MPCSLILLTEVSSRSNTGFNSLATADMSCANGRPSSSRSATISAGPSALGAVQEHCRRHLAEPAAHGPVAMRRTFAGFHDAEMARAVADFARQFAQYGRQRERRRRGAFARRPADTRWLNLQHGVAVAFDEGAARARRARRNRARWRRPMFSRAHEPIEVPGDICRCGDGEDGKRILGDASFERAPRSKFTSSAGGTFLCRREAARWNL